MKYFSSYFERTFSHQNINMGGYKIKILLESESSYFLTRKYVFQFSLETNTYKKII